MRVLLINPPIKNSIDLELPYFVRKNEGKYPPLGLMYIASYLRRHNKSETKIFDAVAEEAEYPKIEEYIRNFAPDIVGITAHTHNLIDVINIADIVKKIDSRTHVALGGPHASIFPREASSMTSIDYVIPQDGEKTFSELVRCIEEGSDVGKVEGLYYKNGHDISYTGDVKSVPEIDSLPFPDRSLLDLKMYSSILGRNILMTTAVSSRGCPYNCSFCSTPKGSYRMRSPHNIVEEMMECQDFGIREMHFIDDLFNADEERVSRICDEITRRAVTIKWSFRGRVDRITKDMLVEAKKAGCSRIHLGVETSSDEGLRILNKGISVSHIRQVFRWTREIGIPTVGYFMIGCPHEKKADDARKTLRFSRELDPDFALFNMLMPYPATKLYDDGLKSGFIKNDYWREFSLNPTKDFKPRPYDRWLSKDELTSLLNEAYKSFYFRPVFLFRVLKNTRGINSFKNRLSTGLDMLRLDLSHEKR